MELDMSWCPVCDKLIPAPPPPRPSKPASDPVAPTLASLNKSKSGTIKARSGGATTTGGPGHVKRNASTGSGLHRAGALPSFSMARTTSSPSEQSTARPSPSTPAPPAPVPGEQLYCSEACRLLDLQRSDPFPPTPLSDKSDFVSGSESEYSANGDYFAGLARGETLYRTNGRRLSRGTAGSSTSSRASSESLASLWDAPMAGPTPRARPVMPSMTPLHHPAPSSNGQHHNHHHHRMLTPLSPVLPPASSPIPLSSRPHPPPLPTARGTLSSSPLSAPTTASLYAAHYALSFPAPQRVASSQSLFTLEGAGRGPGMGMERRQSSHSGRSDTSSSDGGADEPSHAPYPALSTSPAACRHPYQHTRSSSFAAPTTAPTLSPTRSRSRSRPDTQITPTQSLIHGPSLSALSSSHPHPSRPSYIGSPPQRHPLSAHLPPPAAPPRRNSHSPQVLPPLERLKLEDAEERGDGEGAGKRDWSWENLEQYVPTYPALQVKGGGKASRVGRDTRVPPNSGKKLFFFQQ